MVVVIWFCTSEYRRNQKSGYYPLSIASFSSEFEQMRARHWKVGPKKRVILVMDGDRWHLSESVKIPLGIYLYYLPSHSPELQPAERLWPADK
ncbi:transposase [Microcoleus sp. Pol7_A1]|uniref:transposase n=1 Tax=Microcoleus sp. Pol7_A1 TaxID=2818893 RepID=UPI004040B89C